MAVKLIILDRRLEAVFVKIITKNKTSFTIPEYTENLISELSILVGQLTLLGIFTTNISTSYVDVNNLNSTNSTNSTNNINNINNNDTFILLKANNYTNMTYKNGSGFILLSLLSKLEPKLYNSIITNQFPFRLCV